MNPKRYVSLFIDFSVEEMSAIRAAARAKKLGRSEWARRVLNEAARAKQSDATRLLAEKIAADLFTPGERVKSDRLRHFLGGDSRGYVWGEQAMAGRIEKHLRGEL